MFGSTFNARKLESLRQELRALEGEATKLEIELGEALASRRDAEHAVGLPNRHPRPNHYYPCPN